LALVEATVSIGKLGQFGAIGRTSLWVIRPNIVAWWGRAVGADESTTGGVKL